MGLRERDRGGGAASKVKGKRKSGGESISGAGDGRRARPQDSMRKFFSVRGYLAVLGGTGALYIFLLYLLVHAERRAAGSTIHNIGQAVWYSLATFTTVGYGDIYPVTPTGRIVGSIFLLLGIGLLGFFISYIMEYVNRVRPALFLALKGGKPWYIFTAHTPCAVIFAENLRRVRPEAVMIYAESGSSEMKETKADALCVSWSVEEILERRESRLDVHPICMKENEMDNFLDAQRLAGLGYPIICQSSFMPAHYFGNVSYFSLADCAARDYWQRYPVRKRSETIVLIGFGRTGTMLLDRGIELNVLDEGQSIHYHVFGESEEYCRNRKLLSCLIRVEHTGPDSLRNGGTSHGLPPQDLDSKASVRNGGAQANSMIMGDCVHFHHEPWNEDGKLLLQADRVILCGDYEEENMAVLHVIQRFFVLEGEIYIFNSSVEGVGIPFGKMKEMLTPAYVLHNNLTDMALYRHDRFRSIFEKSCGVDMGEWDGLNSLRKDANYIAVDHLSVKVRILLGEEAPDKAFDEIDSALLRRAARVYHDADEETKEKYRRLEFIRNLRYYRLNNYRLDRDPDDDKHNSPLPCTYEELDELGKRILDASWELLEDLAKHKEKKERVKNGGNN